MPDLFNDHDFGPPDPFTGRSAWPRVDHGVSGRTHATTGHCCPYATLRLAFASAPELNSLASPHTCTRRPIMQKVRRHPSPLRGIGLRPLVSVWFQVLFTRLSPCFSSFNRPTRSLSVIEEYLALAGGPACFTRSSTSSALLWYASQRPISSPPTGLSPALARLSIRFDSTISGSKRPQPQSEDWFGLVRFRSPLLTESMSLSSPAVT